MPRIIPTNSAPAIRVERSAHNYRLIGIEVAPAPGVYSYGLIELGSGLETTLTDLAQFIEIDRMYIHCYPTEGCKRGILLNARDTVIQNSYIADFKSTINEAQAIGGYNGPGPYQILNNYLEAAGENIIFGGAGPSLVGNIPSDIVVKQNYLYKPLSWKPGHPSYAGTPWWVKNLFELKNARRVTIQGNVFENCWTSQQDGFAIYFTVRASMEGAPWAVIENVTFAYNIVRGAEKGVNMLGKDTSAPVWDGHVDNINIHDNLWQISGTPPRSGRLFQIPEGFTNLTIDHNTGINIGDFPLGFDGDPTLNLIFRNNIALNDVWGNGVGTGKPAFDTYAPGATFLRNALIGGNGSLYGPMATGNFFPATIADVNFANSAGGDYHLAAGSPYKLAGTDGKDLGADIDALNAWIAGAAYNLAATPSNVSPGAPITITWSAQASTSPFDWVGLYAVGASDYQYLWWQYTGAPSGSATVTAPSSPGAYEFRYFLNNGYTVATRSGTVTVTAAAGPILSGITAGAITANSANITWATDVPCDTQMDYGLTASYGSSSILNPAMVTAHTVSLTGLSPSQTYHYRVKSRTASGVLAISGDYTFTTTPAPAYSLTANPASVTIGSPIVVSWTAPPGSSIYDWIALFPTGSGNTAYIWWQYTGGATSGTFTAPGPGAVGTYEFRYLPNNGFTDVVRSNAVTVTGGTFTLAATPSTLSRGASITLSWTAPAGRPPSDWIGLFAMGTANTQPVWWAYTGGTSTGSVLVTAPATAGTYEFRYLLNNGYADAGRSNTVTVQ
jgi:hypothetical protein